jgi:hypothetical protein
MVEFIVDPVNRGQAIEKHYQSSLQMISDSKKDWHE